MNEKLDLCTIGNVPVVVCYESCSGIFEIRPQEPMTREQLLRLGVHPDDLFTVLREHFEQVVKHFCNSGTEELKIARVELEDDDASYRFRIRPTWL